jgi:hypothetical protein
MKTGVMHGLFKDWAYGMGKRVSDNAVDAGLFCALPLAATVWYAYDIETINHRCAVSCLFDLLIRLQSLRVHRLTTGSTLGSVIRWG